MNVKFSSLLAFVFTLSAAAVSAQGAQLYSPRGGNTLDDHVVDTKGAKLASGHLEGSVENLPLDVEADVDLIVHISSEMPSSPYVPIGCVSLATTQIIPNEMDILSGQ